MIPLHCINLPINPFPFQNPYIYSTKGNWCELVLYFLLINDEKKILKRQKKLVLVPPCSLAFFFFPPSPPLLSSPLSICSLVNTGVVCNCVLSLSFPLPPFLPSVDGRGCWKKKWPKLFVLSRMQLAHVILVCIASSSHCIPLPILFSFSIQTANVSEQITPMGFWGCACPV